MWHWTKKTTPKKLYNCTCGGRWDYSNLQSLPNHFWNILKIWMKFNPLNPIVLWHPFCCPMDAWIAVALLCVWLLFFYSEWPIYKTKRSKTKQTKLKLSITFSDASSFIRFHIFRPDKQPLIASNPIGNVFNTSPAVRRGQNKSLAKLLRDVPRPVTPALHSSLNFPQNAALVLKGNL